MSKACNIIENHYIKYMLKANTYFLYLHLNRSKHTDFECYNKDCLEYLTNFIQFDLYIIENDNHKSYSWHQITTLLFVCVFVFWKSELERETSSFPSWTQQPGLRPAGARSQELSSRSLTWIWGPKNLCHPPPLSQAIRKES